MARGHTKKGNTKVNTANETNTAKFINADIDLTIASEDAQEQAGLSQVNQYLQMSTELTFTKDSIKAYAKAWKSAYLAKRGKDAERSAATMASARKAILEFTFNLRKEQLADPETWTPDYSSRMSIDFANESNSLNMWAGKCREALRDETPEATLQERFERLIKSARKPNEDMEAHGFKSIETALKQATAASKKAEDEA